MTQKLTTKILFELFSQVYEDNIKNKRIEITGTKKIGKQAVTIISPGLKVRKKDTGELFTVSNVEEIGSSLSNVTLRDSNNMQKIVQGSDLERDYEL